MKTLPPRAPISPRLILILTAIVSINACQKYRFSINNNEVYSPPALFGQFKIEDKALDTCVRQTIADQNVYQVEALTRLNCSNAGIVLLKGLEQFTWLERVDLSGNKIVDGSVLRKFTRLKYLKITDNPELNCAELPETGIPPKIEVVAPTHCQSKAP